MVYRKPFQKDEANTRDLESGVVGAGSSQDPNASAAGGSGAWTNLQTYIDTNKGAGAGIANAVTNKVQGDVDAVGKQQAEWEAKAKEKTDGATRQDKFSSQIKADPSKVNQEEFSAWKNLGNFMGEKDVTKTEGYGDVQEKVNDAQSDVKGANDYYGQKALAAKTFGQSGDYSQGMGALDTFVARADETGKQAFQNFQDKNANIGKNFSSAVENINKYIGGAEQRGKEAYDKTLSAVNEGYKGLQSTGKDRRQTDIDAAFWKAQDDVAARYKAAGLEEPRQATGYLNPRAGDDQAYLDEAELAALNSLAGMDDDANTNALGRGQKGGYDIDWSAVDRDISGGAALLKKTTQEPPAPAAVPAPKATQLPTPGTINLPLPVDLPGYVPSGTDAGRTGKPSAPLPAPGVFNIPLPWELPAPAPAPAPKVGGGKKAESAKNKKITRGTDNR